MNSHPEMMKFTGFSRMKSEIERKIEIRDNSILSTGRQVHMLCTTVGLLVFVPKVDDVTYIVSQRNGVSSTRSNSRDSQSRRFGNFEKFVIIPIEEIKPLLIAAHSDYHSDLKIIRNAARNSRDFYSMVQDSRVINFMRLTRQIRFICTGMIVYGVRPSIRAFQFMYTIMSFDVLMFGRYYEDGDKDVYNAMENLILDTETIKLGGTAYEFPTVIDVYKFKRCNLQTKGSILLLPERSASDKLMQRVNKGVTNDIDSDFKNEGVGLARVITRSSIVRNVTNSFSHESSLSVSITGGDKNIDMAKEFETLGRAASNIQLNGDNNGNESKEKVTTGSDDDEDWS